MKQIFDWLREQIVNRKAKNDFLEDRVWNHAMRVCIEIVDEAEAKWEADCCEWKYNEGFKQIILSPHEPHSALWVVDLKHYPYCNHCGKPINITEVE